MMSCHVMSCHVMSCHVMSCHVMSCHLIPCHVMIGRHLRDNLIPCILNRLALFPFSLFFCMLALYIGMVARQLSSLEAGVHRILRYLVPIIYYKRYHNYKSIDLSRLPEGYRNAPLIASALWTLNQMCTDKLVAIQSAVGRDSIDEATAIQAAADQRRIDQAMAIQAAAGRRRTDKLGAIRAAAGRRRSDKLGAIQAAADQERIDQAIAIRAAADQERIDQAIAIQAAADQTIAENVEVCLISF